MHRLLPVFRSANNDYDAFKKKIGEADLLSGIDNQKLLTDDEAYELANSVWQDVSSDAKTKEDSLFSFIEYLELIRAQAVGFIYQLAESFNNDKSGDKKELLGVLWMTVTMRRNLELFGTYLCFDMMKSVFNTLLRPYVAVALLDEFNELCIGCEGIVCGKTDDM